MPFLELFDAPDACDAYRRTTSVVPQQALALVNNELVLDLSRRLAGRLWLEADAGDAADAGRRFPHRRLRANPVASAHARERALAADFLARQTALLQREAGPTPRGSGPDDDPGAAPGTWSTPCSATTTSSRSTESKRPEGEESMTRSRPIIRGLDRPCGRIRRRTFLADVGLGFTGLALGAMLHRDGVVRAEASRGLDTARRPAAFRARGRRASSGSSSPAASATWRPGIPSRCSTGMPARPTTRPGCPAPSSRRCSASGRGPSSATTGRTRRSFPLQVGFKKHGQAGVEISDWWPHLATCVDDIAFVRSMYTTDNDHAAEFQMHHGRHKLDERQPVIGSWIHYGLGT